MNNFLILYFAFVGLSGLLMILWLWRSINKTEHSRKRRINKLNRSESAKTETPLDKPEIEAKETAVESIENRFSIIRRVSFFSIEKRWDVYDFMLFFQGFNLLQENLNLLEKSIKS